MEIKKSTLYLAFVIVLIVGAGFIFLKPTESLNTNGNVVAKDSQDLSGNAREVVLGMKNYNYYPSEIKIKAGEKVSLKLDDGVKGCLRSIKIKDLGLSKFFQNSDDSLDFVPSKKGTFTFACSMGMGFGKLIVE